MFFFLFKNLRNRYTSVQRMAWSLLAMCALIAVIYGIEHASGSDMFQTPWDAVWWGVITSATIGYGDKFPETALGQCIAIVYIFFSLGIVAELISKINAKIFSNHLRKMHGTLPFTGSDHIIIYGTDSQELYDLLEQLIAELPTTHLVVMLDEKEIPKRLKHLQERVDIHFISGKPDSHDALAHANVKAARQVALLSEKDGNADRNLLAYAMYIRSENSVVPLTVEIRDSRTEPLMRSIGVTKIVNTGRISRRLFAKSITDNISDIFEDLLGNAQIGEIYEVAVSANWPGKTLFDLQSAHPEMNIISLRHVASGEVTFDFREQIAAGDKAYIVAHRPPVMVS